MDVCPCGSASEVLLAPGRACSLCLPVVSRKYHVAAILRGGGVSRGGAWRSETPAACGFPGPAYHSFLGPFRTRGRGRHGGGVCPYARFSTSMETWSKVRRDGSRTYRRARAIP